MSRGPFYSHSIWYNFMHIVYASLWYLVMNKIVIILDDQGLCSNITIVCNMLRNIENCPTPNSTKNNLCWVSNKINSVPSPSTTDWTLITIWNFVKLKLKSGKLYISKLVKILKPKIFSIFLVLDSLSNFNFINFGTPETLLFWPPLKNWQ